MRTILRLSRQLLTAVLLVLLQLYRFLVSPVLHMIAPGSGCRFYPTCSDYAVEAVRVHGPVRGLWLAIRRLSRCHPLGGDGFDPVPDACSCTVKTDHQHLSPFNESPPKETNPAGQ